MDHRRKAAVGAAVVLAATLGVVVWTVADGGGDRTVEVRDPHPPERTIDYWTEERLRDAEPAPMPTVPD